MQCVINVIEPVKPIRESVSAIKKINITRNEKLQNCHYFAKLDLTSGRGRRKYNRPSVCKDTGMIQVDYSITIIRSF